MNVVILRITKASVRSILLALITALFAMAVSPGQLYSQSSQAISFEARQESLRSVLNRLSTRYNLNITYNASDSIFDRKITYTASNKLPLVILKEILQDNGHKYHESGNHLVILKRKENTRTVSVKTNQVFNEPKTSHQPRLQHSVEDTLTVPVSGQLIRDTIIIRDTVLVTEEKVIRDTVYIERAPQREATRPEALLRDLLGVEIDGRNRWAVGLAITQMTTDYRVTGSGATNPELEKVREADAFSVRNFGLGASVQYNVVNLSIIASFAVNSFSNRFSYSELFTSGGFNRIDTIDSFFTIVNTDTLWTHITDTTYIPLDSQEVIFDRMNHLGFFETALGASWIFWPARSISWYARANVHASTPLWLRAQTIDNAPGLPAKDITRANFSPWVFAWSGGLGARLRINQISDLFAEAWYRSYINEWNRNFPLERKMHGAGIRLGILYYF